jgi:hypothetical protein
MKNLKSYLPEKPESDNRRGFSESGIRATDSLHCDRAESDACGIVIGDGIGNRDDEIPRDAHDLRMVRVQRTRSGDTKSDGEIINTGADLDYPAGKRIAGWASGIQFSADCIKSATRSLGEEHIDTALQEVGTSADLVGDAFRGRFNSGKLGSGRDAARERADEDEAGSDRRGGDVGNFDMAFFYEELLHDSIGGVRLLTRAAPKGPLLYSRGSDCGTR